MYVEVNDTGAAVHEADNLQQLEVRAAAGADLGSLGALGTVDDSGTHVWLSVAALREAAAATVSPGERAAWSDGFDGMIAYATSKGWMSPDATCVRAHLA